MFCSISKNCRSYHQHIDNDICRCFSLFFYKNCNIKNIKIILFFYWPFSTVSLIIICFLNSLINAKNKFWGVPHLFHLCDFSPSVVHLMLLFIMQKRLNIQTCISKVKIRTPKERWKLKIYLIFVLNKTILEG